MVRAVAATIAGMLVGGLTAFALIVFTLEALHTKDTLVSLFVFAAGASIGGFAAIQVRRAIKGRGP